MEKTRVIVLMEELITQVLNEINFEITPQDFQIVCSIALEDLKAFASKDPSSQGDIEYIIESYLSYRAVLMYRLANFIANKYYLKVARKISEIIKVRTGIEIHPKARIGSRFVLDHGVGTVIGETVSIGDDCYFLQNIILGSKSITNNPFGLRHPQIGNNVEIGGFVKIYGYITIGNNVKISPNAIIRSSIPDNTTVVLGTEYQVLKNINMTKLIYEGYRNESQYVTLFIKNLTTDLECFIDDEKIDYISCTNKILIARDRIKNLKPIFLKQNQEEIIIKL